MPYKDPERRRAFMAAYAQRYATETRGPCAAAGCTKLARAGCAGYCTGHQARRLAGRPVDVTLADRERITPEKFWALVAKGEGCWLWQGATGEKGYGYRGRGETFMQAHRYSWELAFGPIPDGLFVCHECDNPPCVRPDHLFLGTSEDNNRDRQRKGRTVVPRLKLTWNDVVDIRTLAGLVDRAAMADAYGVTPMTIERVVSHETWRETA